MAGITVCIQTDPEGPIRKITKLIPMSDGGFSVLVPYHSGHKGVVSKIQTDYRRPAEPLSGAETVEFGAEDKVKLSLHYDGFAQFSGEQQGKIRSGRDENGTPKGIGVIGKPLADPVRTGPTFAVIVWGLDEFDEWKSTTERPLLFVPEDIYDRPPDLGNPEKVAYLIEGMMFPMAYFWPHLHMRPGARSTRQMTLPLWCNQAPGRGGGVEDGEFLEWVIVPGLGNGRPLMLGLTAVRVEHGFASSSGYQLAGPAEATKDPIKWRINAQYPGMEDRMPQESLAWRSLLGSSDE
jgi:hypothetical protein